MRRHFDHDWKLPVCRHTNLLKVTFGTFGRPAPCYFWNLGATYPTLLWEFCRAAVGGKARDPKRPRRRRQGTVGRRWVARHGPKPLTLKNPKRPRRRRKASLRHDRAQGLRHDRAQRLRHDRAQGLRHDCAQDVERLSVTSHPKT